MIPILEILGERPKTLAELRDQIKSAGDTVRTAVEWTETISQMKGPELGNISGNLQLLLERADTMSDLLDRKDIVELAQVVPLRPQPSSDVPDASESLPAPTLFSRAQDMGTKAWESLTPKNISIGLGAVAGAIGARWLWRKMYGDSEHDGPLKKAGKWTLSILAAIGGAIGVSNVIKWWKNENADTATNTESGPVTGIPVDVADAGRDITKGAGGALDTMIVQPVLGAAEIVQAAVIDGDPAEVLRIVAEKGWSVMFDEHGHIVIHDTLLKPITAPLKATWNLMSEKGRNSEDFFLVWGEAGAAYLIAKKTAQLWSSGKSPIPLSLKDVVADAIRIAAGPVQPWMDGLRTLNLAANKDGMKALALRYGPQSYLGRLVQNYGNTNFMLRIGNESHALNLLTKYERLTEHARIMKGYSSVDGFVSFSKAEFEALDKLLDNTVDSVMQYLRTVDSPKSPVLAELKAKVSAMPWENEKIREKTAEILGEFKNKQPPLAGTDDVGKLLDEAFDAGKAGGAAGAADTHPFADDATKVPPVPDDGSGLKKAVGDGVVEPAPATKAAEVADAAADAKFKVVRPDGTVVDAVTGKAVGEVAAEAADATIDSAKTAKQIEILVKQKPIAEALGSLGEGDDVAREAFLRLCKDLTPDDLIRINRSTSAQKLFAGAIVAKDPAEVTRLMKATSKAGSLMRGLSATAGAAGIAGDLFGMYIAFVDFQEYGNKIEATKNPALADFYGHCQLMCTAEGAASAVGLTYQGIAVVGSLKAGGGIVTALGAPAGLIAVPIAIAAVGVAVTRRGLQESVEYHSSMEQDLLSYPPGKLIEHIAKSSSMSSLNWTQDLFLENSVLANRSAREEAYCAYFRQIAMTSVSPYSFDDLPKDTQDRLEALPDDKRSEEERKTLSNAHLHAMSQFVIDSYQYVKLVDNNYEKPLPQTLKNAEIFARIQSTKRRNKQDVLPLRLVDINPVVADIAKSDTVDAMTLLPLLKESPQGFAMALLSYVRHELALADYHILATDYSNLTQMSSNVTMQAFARGALTENVVATLRGLSSKIKTGGTLSSEDFLQSIDRLQRALSSAQDLNTLAKNAAKRPDMARIQQIGTMPTLHSSVLAEFVKS